MTEALHTLHWYNYTHFRHDDLLALFQVATRGNGATTVSATMFIASLVTSLFFDLFIV